MQIGKYLKAGGAGQWEKEGGLSIYSRKQSTSRNTFTASPPPKWSLTVLRVHEQR